jgi:hypothetical protein
MRRAELKQLVATTAEARLEFLRSQPYAQLAQLPSHGSDTIAGTKAVVATYRDDIGAGRLRIVVQAVLPGWLGSAFIRPYGFTVDPGGSIATLSEEALWDFT